VRIAQNDYPGTFAYTYSQPLEIGKGDLWTFDIPLQARSLCPFRVTAFLCFKGSQGVQKMFAGGYGAGLVIARSTFDVLDMLCPLLQNPPITNPLYFPHLSAHYTADRVNSLLKDVNRKFKLAKPTFLLNFNPPSASLHFRIGPPFSLPASPSENSSTPSASTVLHHLLSAGETNLPPHKVMQNTGLAVGTSPFGEKFTLTTTILGNTKPPPAHPPLIGLEVQCQNLTSIPLLRHTVLQRFLRIRGDGENFPVLNVADFEEKIRTIQKSLRETVEQLDELKTKQQHMVKVKKVNGEKIKRKEKEQDDTGDEGEEETVPIRKEEDLRKMLDIVGKCISLYEQSRALLGKEFHL